MFVRQPDLGSTVWPVLYVGQTTSFLGRLPFHERWEEAVRRGAAGVAICPVLNAMHRAELEAELIAFCHPPLNDRLKPSGMRGLYR